MKIDKSKFLVLTSVLAAGTAAAAMSTGACTTTTNNPTDGGTSSVDGSSGGTDGSSGGTDGSSGGGDGATDGGDDGSACLGDDKVLNPSCSSFLEAGTDAGGSCLTSLDGQDACTSFQANLRNGVAREAVNCLKIAPTCEALPDPVGGCLDQAAAKACPDTAVDALCTAELAKCTAGAITKADCVKYMTALTPAARTKFTTNCADEVGCSLSNADAVKSCILFNL